MRTNKSCCSSYQYFIHKVGNIIVQYAIRRLTDKQYKYIYTRVPRLCVDIVLIDKDKILLSKRSIEPHKGKWHLPGGRVYMHETLLHAFERICNQELGIHASFGPLVGYLEFVNDGEFVHSVSFVFLAKATNGKVKPISQATEVKWWGEIPNNSHPEHKMFLESHLSSFITK